jgi:hypothetical protein
MKSSDLPLPRLQKGRTQSKLVSLFKILWAMTRMQEGARATNAAVYLAACGLSQAGQ